MKQEDTLSANRAFVVQFYQPTIAGKMRFQSRAEHLTSGRVANFSSRQELGKIFEQLLIQCAGKTTRSIGNLENEKLEIKDYPFQIYKFMGQIHEKKFIIFNFSLLEEQNNDAEPTIIEHAACKLPVNGVWYDVPKCAG